VISQRIDALVANGGASKTCLDPSLSFSVRKKPPLRAAGSSERRMTGLNGDWE
jgi:hypothetical protein